MTAFIPKTWIKKDLHVHENHSSDAPGATVERYCRVAEVRGIDEIAFTTHLIIAGPDIEHGISYNQVPDYLEEIWTAQETTSVKLRTGLEVDYFPSKERHLENIIENLPLDIVLGSLHYIRGIDIGSRRQSPKFFIGKSLESALTIFFEDWRKAIESGLFDVMAHPDYFRKYLSLSRDSPVQWNEYGSSVFDAIDSLKSYDVGFEVNSSGWRHGIKDVYPISDFMKASRKTGVNIITIGSDAHTVQGLGNNTINAAKRLEEAGYSHLCVFKNRKNQKIPLSDIII